jgi:NitT/TauT family transport system ATP-binding protein
VLVADRLVIMTPRPGRVREILEVPLPRPRSLATLSDPIFHELANDIRRRLFSGRQAA